jgi:N-methylhydantoinase A/oxoprolinase/acetone carboxylase beta subunit
MRMGVDTGGTFTDFVVICDDGAVETFKLRSNPRNPAGVILAGIERVATSKRATVVHGSTVATNALLERKGARTAFVTTAGFADIFHIGRQNRRELYNLTPTPRVSLVSPNLCFGVEERMLFDGSEERPVRPRQVAQLRKALEKAKVQSIAICLLHSYQNPRHEEQVAEILRGAGYLSVSSEISPEFREYERSSTTVLNAYVGPLMERYLMNLSAGMGRHELSILQSNGGTIRPDEAQKMPVRTLLSGPAGGAIGAAHVAGQAGFERVLGFDMGGTSTDVCLIEGSPRETTEAFVDGFPVQVPMLDIHTVGAGGGSIARVDEGGLLRVGPQSAGADPGPACYGTGDLCTVTDAHVFLGRIAAVQLAGGTLPIQTERAAAVVAGLAKELKLAPAEAAAGVIRVANANMERALRQVSVERGYDPRRFALLAFGGGGGLHACEIAENLEMHTVLVPELAGVLSALGMLVADRIRDYSQGVLDLADVDGQYRRLERIARAENRNTATAPLALKRFADLRYRGQGYELTVPWAQEGFARTSQAFHQMHRATYGYADETRALEIITIRVRASTPSPKTNVQSPKPKHRKQAPSVIRRVYVEGRWQDVPVVSRAELTKGRTGPVLLVDYGSTTLVPGGWFARLDKSQTLVVKRSSKPGR